MNTNSNSYTIGYAAIMVVIVGFLLSFVNSTLRDTQNKNVELDTKKQILASIGVKNVADADAEYSAYVKQDMLVQADGSLKEYDGKFVTSFANAAAEGEHHVFVCQLKNGETKYIIPVYGAGLWGAIWGYVSLNEDKTTIYGTYFNHASETPGLGAEIATDHFQDQFKSKEVLNGTEVALTVAKAGKVENPTYEVDGISGGTITSNGVDAMLKSCMKNYIPFLTSK